MKELNSSLLLGTESSSRQTSKTDMVKAQEVTLPEVSVTTQVTTVTPTGKAEPEGGLHATFATPQLSLTAGGG